QALVLNFKAPDAALRRRLVARGHPEVCAGIGIDRAVASTEGYSFAEIEELKNPLVMHFMDAEAWDWAWALRQFAINRAELTTRQQRQGGFRTAPGETGPRDDEVA